METKKILVPVANGTEMIEALAVVDVFRRAGAEVDLVSVNELVFTSSHNVKIYADKLIDECLDSNYDLIALPGGIPGAENLKNSESLVKILKRQNASGKLYGAICAAPAVVLEQHGLLEGKKATCHPSFVASLSDTEFTGREVVVDRNCVTSRGAGTAITFALQMVEILMGKEKRREVARGMAIETE